MIIMEYFVETRSKIQARYFWKNVLQMDDVSDMIIKINDKLLKGLKILKLCIFPKLNLIPKLIWL